MNASESPAALAARLAAAVAELERYAAAASNEADAEHQRALAAERELELTRADLHNARAALARYDRELTALLRDRAEQHNQIADLQAQRAAAAAVEADLRLDLADALAERDQLRRQLDLARQLQAPEGDPE